MSTSLCVTVAKSALEALDHLQDRRDLQRAKPVAVGGDQRGSSIELEVEGGVCHKEVGRKPAWQIAQALACHRVQQKRSP